MADQVERVHHALERLRAVEGVCRENGKRDGCNHAAFDRGTAYGINLAIGEVRRALRESRSDIAWRLL